MYLYLYTNVYSMYIYAEKIVRKKTVREQASKHATTATANIIQ